MSSIEKAINQLRKKQPAKVISPGKSTDSSGFGNGVSENQSNERLNAEQVAPKNIRKPEESAQVDKNYSISIIPTLEKHQMVTPALTNTKQAEEYRVIKRPLLANASKKTNSSDQNNNIIMVSSAFPGEGKTYTTINLAASIAVERDRSVLVIDCDVERHALSSMFNLNERSGLLDTLVNDDVDIGDVIVSTDMPTLKIIPAGINHSYTTELLASEHMERIMSEVSKRYPDRVILLDSPPLLLTSQALVIAKHAGQILLVVAEGETSQKAVIDALSKLDTNKNIGAVLNKSSRFNVTEQYGGYYGSYGG